MSHRNRILCGDALVTLQTLPTGLASCIVTSPPYYALRDYGHPQQLGLEPCVHDWVANLRAVFAEAARVLTPTGSLWLNLGDSFSRHPKYGAPTKGLLLGPERLLLALAADGWIVRGKVVWAKPNPMPTSVRDRLAMTHEVVYHLVRKPTYYFDLDAIREPHRTRGGRKAKPGAGVQAWRGPLAGKHDGLDRARAAGMPGHPLGKNPGDVWTIATRGHADHHAAFPQSLVRRPILATCPESVCTRCRSPAGCRCDAPRRPGLVLDPFFGTGTVGLVARELGRDWLGIELNPEFVALAQRQLGIEDQPKYRRPTCEFRGAAA